MVRVIQAPNFKQTAYMVIRCGCCRSQMHYMSTALATTSRMAGKMVEFAAEEFNTERFSHCGLVERFRGLCLGR